MTIAHVHGFEKDAPLKLAEAEHELVLRARSDPSAIGLLYERHAPMLLNYVYRRTGDRHATEDLVADVFVIVLKSLPGYRSRGVPIRYWLMRIATNVVNRWAKQRKKRPHVALDETHASEVATRSTTGDAPDEHLQRALLSLAPRYQAVLSLHHMEGLSVSETATIIGCREGTVRSRLWRAREALRTQLERTTLK
jgi:RNA polymerase sigma-70 factor, ECF subfamily